MMSPRRRAASGFVFAVSLSTTMMAGSSSSAIAEISGRQKVVLDLPEKSLTAAFVAPLASTQDLDFAIVLPMIDLPAATRYALAVSTDFTPQRGKYLTPAEFAKRFGASAASLAAIRDWATRSGLAITEDSGTTVIGLRGSVARIEAALGVTLARYRAADGHLFFAASDTATLPTEIAGAVLGIVGLSDGERTHFAPMSAARGTPAAATAGAKNIPGFSAADLRIAYGSPNALGVASQPIAVFEQGGFDPADIAKYVATNKLPDPAVTVRGVAGYGGGVNDPSIELEAVTDIDMMLATDVGAPIVVYEQGTAGFRTALLESLAAMAKDDRAPTIDIAYGQPEFMQGSVAIAAENQLFVQLAVQGQSVFASAGDNGAYVLRHYQLQRGVVDPSSQPFVTSVGGSTVFTNAAHQRVYETAWSTLGNGHGATGGGASSVWPLPVWQRLYGTDKHHSVASANGGSKTMRNVPDVAALADPFTGVAVYSALNGGWLEIGGTGVSSGLWAGIAGLATSGRVALGLFPLGFFNPNLYYQVTFKFGLGYFDTFDILNGYNGITAGFPKVPPGYMAGINFDDVSGWGSPYIGGVLLGEYVFSWAPFQPGPPPAQGLRLSASSTSVTIDWQPTPGAKGYVVEVLPWPAGYPVPNMIEQPQQINLTAATRFTFTQLQPSTNYLVQVIPSGEHGTLSTPVSGAEIVTQR